MVRLEAGVRSLALAALLGLGCRPARPASVLLITLDTLRADRVGAYSGGALTPNLDSLAARGVVLTRASTPVPLTTPAHASLFTGLYPWRHGVRVHGVAGLDRRFPVLAEDLARHGLATAAFVAAYPLTRAFALDRGFTTYDDYLGTTPAGEARLQRSADEVTGRAGAWLAAHAAVPFFLWVHYYDPHAPYRPPEPFRSRHAADPYAGEVAFLDQEVGRLLEVLRASGQVDRTLVIALADHGEGLDDHGEQEHGLLLYQETLRVPWIMAGPGLPRGRRVAAAASLVDLRPTLLASLGLAAAASDGIDLGPVLRGGSMPERALLAETLFPESELGWSRLRAVTRGDLKAIDAPAPELYDLAGDPGERKNLAPARPEQTRELLAELAQVGEPEAAAGASPDAAKIQALESLGYVSGGAGRPAAGRGADPKQRVDDYKLYWKAIHLGFEDGPAGREEAAAILADLVARDPDCPQFRLKLAMVHERAGRTGEAEQGYRAVLARVPQWPTAEQRLAQLLTATGRAGEAADRLRELRRAHPELVGLEETLALALRATGDRAGALAVAREQLAAHPADVPARLLVGHLAGEQGLVAESRAAFEAVLAADPGNARASLSLARVLEVEGRPDEALAAIERGFELHPGHADLASEGCRLATARQAAAPAQRLCTAARRLAGPG